MFNFMRKSEPGLALSDAIAQVAAGELTLIDIRDHGELTQTGTASGALHIPMMRLPMVADPRHPDFHADLDLKKPVALFCASGARSGMAANMLRQMGYEVVHNIGGFGHWAAAGGPCCKV